MASAVRKRSPRLIWLTRTAAAGSLTGLALTMTPVMGGAAFADTDGISCTSGSVSDGVLEVADGDTCTVSATSDLDELIVDDGGSVVAPDGYDVTLTVDGVETGQAWDSIEDVAGTIQAGDYGGSDDSGVVLTVTTQHTETGSSLVFPIRQSLYVDSDGVDGDESVDASWLGDTPGDSSASNFKATSTGSTFNGVWVDGTDYDLTDPTISLTGNGRSDFVGDGAAIMGTNDANLTVDGADVDDTGVVRTGVISDNGANVVVKNSTIKAAGGTLPSDYTANVSEDTMIAAPWMLGIEGTNRATLLLGTDSKAAYVNSTVQAQDWGALSTDSGEDVELTAINSDVSTTDSGYGTYEIGGANAQMLGTTFNVADYGAIAANGANVIHLGDSDAEDVATLNTDRSIGLTDDELADLEERTTTVNSDRIGVMTWAGASTVTIDGGTTLNTGQAVLEDKTGAAGVATTFNVTGDSTEQPSLNSDENTIMQVMDNDDPGVGGTYTDSTATADGADLTDADADSRTDVNLTDTSVTGNLYNGALSDKNMVVNLDGSTVEGAISSSTIAHPDGYVDEDNYEDIGHVSNTAAAPVNNGVIVDLADGSTWTATGTSYLTSLTVSDDSSIEGADGADVTITIDGVDYSPSELTAGTTYTGDSDDPIIVTAGGSSTATSASTTTVKLSKAKVAYGTKRTATVRVSGGDDTATGTVKVKVDRSLVKTATLKSGKATVTLPAGTAAGKHTVTATYAGDDELTTSTGTAKLTVTKHASTSKLRLATHQVSRHQRVRAVIRVKPGSLKPTGKVTVRRGSRVLARYTLRAAQHGRLVTRLPKIAKAGTYRLRIVYVGNKNIATSHSSTVRLRVTR
ncbi:MAG: Ig-like domain-containing protein [Nocardioides sp.]|uniref:beta strand repeat-containing protein n=1 Tax=Nocardioides sp. TaxID=35761 RepID=UPI0039E48BF0